MTHNAVAEITIQRVVEAMNNGEYVTQDVVAARLGLSRSTVNHAVTEARRRGALDRVKWQRPIRKIERHRSGCLMVRINSGKIVRFDVEDAEMLSRYNWTASYNASANAWYAATRLDGRLVFMHQMLGFWGGDHKNHNGLDNRRRNLRPATPVQQLANQGKGKRKNVTSQYKGVSKTRYGTWIARCRREHLGTFKTEDEAALAYDQRAVELWGEYAFTNCPL